MDRQVLSALKEGGYTYLIKRHGQNAFTPIKGNLEKSIASLSTTPLFEDFIISIDEAIQMAKTEGLKGEMIILK